MNRLENEWEKTRWAWWRNDKLKIKSKTVLYSLQDRISSVYFAPIDSKDAQRMIEISNILDKPYVVHLWDFLDGNIDDAATQLLIRNAKRVFCLNNEIASEVKRIRDADILEFTRSPANYYSSGVKNNCVRVALIGDIRSYLAGVLKLFEAIKILKKTGVSIKIIYIGKMSNIVKLGLYSKGNIEATGFVKDSAERDRILSTCNVAFLPGPGASPEMDHRSKFSIPSRILDFLTAGLPVVGHVHPSSATFAFLRELDFDQETVCCEDPAQIAEALFSLTKSHYWSIANQRSLKAFSKIMDRYNSAILKNELV
jgi:glycosyltransferase involved in cell wall biosynthesis